jgi:hypothetical protein
MSDAESVGSGEDDLIAAARTGSQGAMVELYHRHRNLLIGYVLRMTGDRDLVVRFTNGVVVTTHFW